MVALIRRLPPHNFISLCGITTLERILPLTSRGRFWPFLIIRLPHSILLLIWYVSCRLCIFRNMVAIIFWLYCPCKTSTQDMSHRIMNSMFLGCQQCSIISWFEILCAEYEPWSLYHRIVRYFSAVVHITTYSMYSWYILHIYRTCCLNIIDTINHFVSLNFGLLMLRLFQLQKHSAWLSQSLWSILDVESGGNWVKISICLYEGSLPYVHCFHNIVLTIIPSNQGLDQKVQLYQKGQAVWWSILCLSLSHWGLIMVILVMLRILKWLLPVSAK